MKNESLESWLVNEKNMSLRAARDVVSRQKRVMKLVGSDTINENTLDLLISNKQFLKLSLYIKSQLKRATVLVLEYQESVGE